MKLSFKFKSVIASSLLFSIFILAGVFVSGYFVDNINRNSSSAFIDSNLANLTASIQALEISQINQVLDSPLESEMALAINPHGFVALNNFINWSQSEITNLEKVPFGHLTHFQGREGSFWVKGAQIQAVGGIWKVFVAHNAGVGSLIAKKIVGYLIFAGIIIFLLFISGAWLLATYILKSVARLQNQASALAESETNNLLVLPKSDDEIAGLTRSLNLLLKRVYSSLNTEKQLVTDISHELRTPLTIMISRVEILLLDEHNPARLEALQALSSTAHEMKDLVNNLLFLAQKRTNADLSRVNPDQAHLILVHTIDQMRILGSARNIEINFKGDFDSDIPLDAQDLKRVLTNLIMNSLNACDENGVIGVEYGVQNGIQIIEVTDNGRGIPPEFAGIAFERFTRADKARTRDTGGSGLGLAIVKAIVETASGSISISSSDSNMTIVRILLPAPTA